MTLPAAGPDSSKPIRFVLTTSFGMTAVLAGILLARDPSWRRLLLVVALGAALAASRALVPHFTRRGKPVDWMIAIAVLNALLLGAELGLRLGDFRYEAGIQFGFPRRQAFASRFVPDPDLFWKYPPERSDVNAWGFRDQDPRVPKPAGVYRMVFLGDSCTDLGDPANYPTLAEGLLNARSPRPELRFESVVLAVSGYSSHQGRVAADSYAPRLQPDAAFVYFGWNDHWQAYGATDSEKAKGRLVGPRNVAVEAAFERSRLLQLTRKLSESVRRSRTDRPLERVRVSPAEYRANLSAIRRVFTAQGATTVFITAPTSWYRLGVPDRFMALRYVPDKATALDRHRGYNQIVRDVAREPGAILLDLETQLDRSETLEAVMIEDGVHFNNRGIQMIAEEVAVFVRSRLLSDSGFVATRGG